METPKKAELAYIGKSVIIKGELSGSEDLYVDGQIEGSVHLDGNKLTIGPSGRVKADVTSKSVIIEGILEGAIRSSDRTELRKSASATGEISTQRIAIEEGAMFKGKLDVQREEGKAASSNK